MTNEHERKGVSPVFWIATLVAFTILFPLFWSGMADLPASGKITIGCLVALMFALLAGLLADAIASIISLAKAGEFKRKYMGSLCMIIGISGIIGLVYNRIPKNLSLFLPMVLMIPMVIIRFAISLRNKKHNQRVHSIVGSARSE